jgi:hypothetical protein
MVATHLRRFPLDATLLVSDQPYRQSVRRLTMFQRHGQKVFAFLLTI